MHWENREILALYKLEISLNHKLQDVFTSLWDDCGSSWGALLLQWAGLKTSYRRLWMDFFQSPPEVKSQARRLVSKKFSASNVPGAPGLS